MAIEWAAVADEMQAAVGFVEGPNNENPWGPEQGVRNAAYCASFAHVIPYHHGYRFPPESQFGDKGDAYVPFVERHARDHGEWADDHASRGEPCDLQPGDMVTFDWNLDGIGDHVETVVDNYGDPYGPTFRTIGANTGDPQGVHQVERDRYYLNGRRRMGEYGDRPSVHPMLREGDQGPAVVELQTALTRHGSSCDADGDFGPQTAAAVRQFQQARQLEVDGVVGLATWAALDAP